jgi:four helix bundle protein
MKYEHFEDLPVWQVAADLAAKMFVWTEHPSFRGKGDLANQLQRASLSISNNIAEGFERGTTKELLQFIYIARGSAGEVQSMLAVMDRVECFGELDCEIEDFKQLCKSISRQLHGWASSLQNSPIEGRRHLNEKTQSKFDYRQRLERHDSRQQQWKQEFEARLKAQAAQRRELEEQDNQKNEEPES